LLGRGIGVVLMIRLLLVTINSEDTKEILLLEIKENGENIIVDIENFVL